MNTNTKKVLIAEDDRTIASAIAQKFALQGFETKVCHDGVECLDVMNNDTFDVILLDIIMPKKTGFDVMGEKSKTKNPLTPVYVLTNLGQDNIAEQAMTMGAVKVFVKTDSPLKEVVGEISGSLGK